MKQLRWSSILISALLWSTSPASADYTVVLKNGRQIRVQSYREEDGMVKFLALGGEIAINKDQIRSIEKGNTDTQSGLTIAEPSPPITSARDSTAADRQAIAPTAVGGNKPTADAELKEQRAKEEKEYENRLKEITQQLNQVRDRYSSITRGNTGSEPAFFTTEEAFRGHQEDLLSRLRDAQNRAQGLATGSASQSPPFSLNPPPAYSEKEKELSDLRSKMNRLETEREQLIGEMKQKKFAGGSVFLE